MCGPVRVCELLAFVFFFSSRRRHTRCSRDWSSDVCSSDLRGRSGPDRWAAEAIGLGLIAPGALWFGVLKRGDRSEERRVGKECRSRSAAHPEEKKKQDMLEDGNDDTTESQ